MSHHISKVSLHHDKYPDNNQYPFSLPLFNLTDELSFVSPVTFFVGENGTGKSTLLEAMALSCNIHIWRRDESATLQTNEYERQLYRFITVHWVNGTVPGAFFGSETFYDFRRIVENWAASDPGQLKYFGGKSLVAQSHGQSMMSYFESRYKLEGIYFLDEPETALSPKSQLKLLEIMKENTRAGHAQFIVATHSPILLSLETAKIYSFDSDTVRSIEYTETDHFKVYKSILNQQ